MNPDIERILSAAIQAPSGENSQPWRFIVRGDTVEVWCRPERDQSSYNWGQRGSFMATGAAIENMVIAASRLGRSAEVAYFPSAEKYHVATAVFTRGGTDADPLADQIPARVSNRKPFDKAPLTDDKVAGLERAADEAGYGSLRLYRDRPTIERLAGVGGANEEVMLSNDALHAFFFAHVSWTKEEDDRKKMGFYIETLELPPPGKAAFRLLKNPSVARALRHIGFPKIVAAQNATTYASAGAIGVITGAGTEPIDFVKAGRTLERVWLTATAEGLSLQPLAGIIFLALRASSQDAQVFTAHDREMIEAAHRQITDVTGGSSPVMFMFRVGTSGPPSARASRFPLTDAVEIADI